MTEGTVTRLDVETERTKARGVATMIVHAGADLTTEVQRLRSWVLTRGLQPEGHGSWTLTDGDDFQVRHDIDRDDIETETVPQERAWLQAIPSQYVARVTVPRELEHDAARIGAALREWALRFGYELEGDAEAVLPPGDGEAMTVFLPIGRPVREDWIEV